MAVPCVVEPQAVQTAIYKSAMAADLTAARGRSARQQHGLEQALLPLPPVEYFLGGAAEAGAWFLRIKLAKWTLSR